jgi:hypothetical protein
VGLGYRLPDLDPARRDRLPRARQAKLSALSSTGITKMHGSLMAPRGVDLDGAVVGDIADWLATLDESAS